MRLVSTFCDANKLDIPKEMNKFLERYEFQKLDQVKNRQS